MRNTYKFLFSKLSVKVVFLAVFLLANAYSGHAAAQHVSRPDTLSQSYGCANDTWIAMTNRAAMVTRRQDMMNKRYIIKPDSVLQYSCFVGELERAGLEIAPIFSNGEQWFDREVPLGGDFLTRMQIYSEESLTEVHSPAPPGSFTLVMEPGHNYRSNPALYLYLLLQPDTLEKAIFTTVLEQLILYTEGHFTHPVLAGTTEYTPPEFMCNNMAAIWQAAKCKNFDDESAFYRLEQLEGTDPRIFPPNMLCEL